MANKNLFYIRGKLFYYNMMREINILYFSVQRRGAGCGAEQLGLVGAADSHNRNNHNHDLFIFLAATGRAQNQVDQLQLFLYFVLFVSVLFCT